MPKQTTQIDYKKLTTESMPKIFTYIVEKDYQGDVELLMSKWRNKRSNLYKYDGRVPDAGNLYHSIQPALELIIKEQWDNLDEQSRRNVRKNVGRILFNKCDVFYRQYKKANITKPSFTALEEVFNTTGAKQIETPEGRVYSRPIISDDVRKVKEYAESGAKHIETPDGWKITF